jgi:hypothetical protein
LSVDQLLSAIPSADCKGDLLNLTTGCGYCRKCRLQLVELLDRHRKQKQEDVPNEHTKHAETLMLAGQVMGQALRYAKGDLQATHMLLKIATTSTEAIIAGENLKSLAATVLEAMGHVKPNAGSPGGSTGYPFAPPTRKSN